MKKQLLNFFTAASLSSLLVAPCTIFAQVPSYIPTNGLQGWWPFNGNANDESGNGNNGTVNGATLTSDRFGNANSAYEFDGLNDIISSQLINPLQTTWSLSFWFKSMNSASDFQGQNVIGLGSDMYGWGGAGFQIHGQIPPGQCSTFNYLNHMYLIDASQECGGNFLDGGLYSNSTWYNVVIIKTNTSYDLIINNTLIATNILLTIDIDQLIFGNRDISFQYFKGQIDEIGIWNRALTDQEVTSLYQGCSGSITSQPSNQNINISSGTVQFSVSTSASTPTYQWQTNLGVGFQNLSNVGQYSGTTTNTLSVTNVSMTNNNQPFRCIINSGGCPDTSDVAVLSVVNNAGIMEGSLSTVKIFPNPANEVLYIIKNSENEEAYVLFDASGRKVLEGKFTSKESQISLTSLQSGTYLLKVGTNELPLRVVRE
jgi:hypothetical protein